MSETRDTAGVTGIVLAGGRSSRFGADKLAAELDGRPLLAHAIVAVAAVAAEVLVVAAPGSTPDLPRDLGVPIRVVHDPEAHGGPLVGVLAGASAATHPQLIVVAGDMPGLAPAVLAALLEAVDPPTVSAIHLAAGERIQPLPFAASTGAVLATAADRLAAGSRSLRDLLLALDAVALPEATWRPLDPEGTTLRDVDVPADLDATRDRDARHRDRRGGRD